MREEHLAVTLSQIPGIKRFIKIAREGTGEMDRLKGIKQEVEFERWMGNKTVDAWAKAYYWYGSENGRVAMDKTIEAQADWNDQQRLMERARRIDLIKDLDNRTSWLSVWYEPAKVRAAAYNEKLKAANTAEKRRALDEQFSIVLSAGGFTGDEFWRELSKLQ